MFGRLCRVLYAVAARRATIALLLAAFAPSIATAADWGTIDLDGGVCREQSTWRSWSIDVTPARVAQRQALHGQPSAQAVNLIVDTVSDASPGVAANCATGSVAPCSLRDAIAAANAQAAGMGSTIVFDSNVFASAQTITLTQGVLLLTGDATITGPGAALLSISGGRTNDTDGSPVLQIGDANLPTQPTAQLSGVTLTRGNVNHFARQLLGGSAFSTGSGLLNNGNLTVTDCVISDNRASDTFYTGGAAIANANTLTLQRTRVVGNSEALHVTSGFSSSLYGVIFSLGVLTIEDSEIADNTAIGDRGTDAEGAGVFATGTATIRRSAIVRNSFSVGADNRGFYQGAGLYFQIGSLTLDDVTIADNSIVDAHGGNTVGGAGIFVSGIVGRTTTAVLHEATITANRLQGSAFSTVTGAGAYVYGAATLELANSVVGGNVLDPSTPSTYADIHNDGGTVVDDGGNLYDASASTTSVVNGLAFGALGDYGGLTDSLLPLPGSRAICAGRASNVQATAPTDQRGAARVEPGYDGYSAASPCVDAGAIQTHYALTFSPPPASLLEGATFSPTVVVVAHENGQPLTTGNYVALTPADLSSLSVAIAAASGTLTGSTFASLNPANGLATFNGLGIGGFAGTDTLKATLALDASPLASVSSTSAAFSVLQSASATLAASANPATYGTTLTLTATVVSTPAAPTGTVAFTDAGATIFGCSAVLLVPAGGSFVATCTVSGANANLLDSGTHPLVATYAGDAHSIGAVSSTLSVTITRADQVIAFGPAPSLAVGGTATVTATGGASGQPVVFATTSPAAICTVDIAGHVSAIGAGTCVVTADQSGGVNYNAAPQATLNVSIHRIAQAITFGPAPNLAVGGTATVTATGGASGQPVVFATTSPASICSVSAAGLVSAVGAGTCVVIANQAGSANYTAAPQATQSVTIGRAAQTITFGPAPGLAVGGTATVTATGGASGSPVTFGTSSAATVCSVAPSGLLIAVGAGTCIVTADQSGNADYDAAPRATLNIVIARADQAIVFGPAPLLVLGQSAQVTATGGGSGNPILFGTTSAASICTIAANGVVDAVGPGNCTVTADQAGSVDYNAAPQVTLTLTIAPVTTQLVLVSSLNPSQAGQSVTFTASVAQTTTKQAVGAGAAATSAMAATPVGSVIFSDGTTVFATVTLDASGQARTTTAGLALGAHAITASYAGNGTNVTASASLVQQVIAPADIVPAPMLSAPWRIALGGLFLIIGLRILRQRGRD